MSAGRLGQKAGKGFYRYEGRTRIPDPQVLALIEARVARISASRAAAFPMRRFSSGCCIRW